jgi:menaquinol-cytochrome c reductase cytochrome b/c subunit
MAEIPESLLRRSAEAKAKALGLPVEQVLAEMKGEKVPEPPSTEGPVAEPKETPDARRQTPNETGGPMEGTQAETPEETPEPQTSDLEPPTDAETPAESGEPAAAEAPAEPPAEVPEPQTTDLEPPTDAEPQTSPESEGNGGSEPAKETEPAKELVSVAARVSDAPPTTQNPPAAPQAPPDAPPAPEAPSGNGSGNGKRATLVQPRPVAPAAGLPQGVRTQRLLTVVKARAIQQVKTEPTDKVNTWPHLMIGEFAALLAVTAVLIILSVILQAPLLDPANFNATPNPSKAPWYFLGLQELLSYFDPQIAGVTVPTIVGLVGFMAVPYVDRNPSTKPSDRKFAIMLYTLFMAGAATLTIFGVLFRGRGFNFSYPWKDGVFFDDLKDWVHFE